MSNSEEVLPVKLQESIDKIACNENFIRHSIKSRNVPLDGGSYMGILREITIKGETDKGDKEINLFVKTIFPGAELSIYSLPGAYEKETTVYNNIFKAFDKLQEEANVPLKERYNMPKTYEGVDSESIIMENLKKKGFTMCERLKVLPLKFVELTIQQLAKLHCISFVLQTKRPEFFEAKVKNLYQLYYFDTPAWNMFVSNVSRMALTTLDPEPREKMEAYLPTTYAKYAKLVRDLTVNTIVHHDFKASNVMVKYNGGEMSDAVIIDFQNAFYGCPIIDFFYFIFSGTDQEFRRQHLENLKTLYHDTMTQFLKYFDLDINHYYSRKEFERIYKEKLEYGLIISLWLVPIALADNGDIQHDITKVDLRDVGFRMNETVRSRVRGVVDDFIKWGYV